MKTLAALILLTLSSTALAAEGSAESGKVVFKKCTACHNAEQATNKVGPHLDGVVGRPAAALADYTNYSDAMKEEGAKGLTWDEATLATYLAGPKKMIPKTRMAFSGLKSEQDIADVIAYLKSVKAQ
ncbi:UNVERIFIED_ORG: cytochrome c [Shinella zoogloeoides]|nr:cytochrome c [Shinella zoogloeoides]